MQNHLEIKNSSIFSSFPAYELGTSSTAKNTQKNVETTNLLKKQQEAVDTIEITNEKETKSKKKKILFGSTLASAIFTTGIVSLFLLKGFHGSSFSKLSRLSEKLTRNLQGKNQKPKDLITKTSYFVRKGTKKTTESLEATANFTAIKDWICNKIFRTNKVTSKFADSTTAGFKKVVDKTMGKQYDKVEVRVKDLTSLLKHYNSEYLRNIKPEDKLAKITIKGQTKTLEEWLNILSKQGHRLETEFDKSFSLGARRIRDKKRISLLADLPEKIGERFFKNKTSLFNPQNYKSYATEELSKEAKEELQKEILKARKNITNNINTIHDSIRSSLSHFAQGIKPDDEASRKSIQELKQLFESFKNCSGENEAKIRDKISKEIAETVDKIIKSTQTNSAYTQAEKDNMLKIISEIKETVLSTGAGSKGSLEEIMTILNGLKKSKIKINGEKILTEEQYKELLKLSGNIRKNLNKATEMEINEYFIKQAEMKIGSSPTDVLSVLFPIGVGAYTIGSGDSKDEKISATLTTCIPLVGSFATFVYGTTKMLSGVKNLGVTFISGIALKIIGNTCDKLYQKYKKTGSVTNVFKDEYDKFLNDFEDKNVKEKKK